MQNQIVINNSLISYTQLGTGENTVLFLHGWRSQKEVWNEVVNRLLVKNNNLSVFLIDFPGFGNSPAPHIAWSVGDYAEMIKGFMQKLGLKNAVVVGHSFGGRVGIKLASTCPELVKKLVLVDSAGFVQKGRRELLFNLIARMVRPFFKLKLLQGLRKKIYKSIGADDYLSNPELRETFLNTINEDLTEDIKRIKVSTLIIWGEDDKETPVEFGQRMNSIIHDSKFIIFPSSGHFSFLDKPHLFIESILDFIK